MSRYVVSEVSGGEFEYVEDDWEFQSIAKSLLFEYFSHSKTGVKFSEPVLRYYRDEDWSFCDRAPDKHRCTEDAPSYVMHALINNTAMWELKDDGKIHTLKEKIVTCFSAEEDDDYIYMETHPVGQCPYLEYYKDVHRKIILKAEIVLYFEAEGDDTDNMLHESMSNTIRAVVDEDILSDRFMDEYEYDRGGEISYNDYRFKTHKYKVTEVKKIP